MTDLLAHRIPSPIGPVLLITDGAAVRALDFGDYETRLHRLLALHVGRYRLSEAPAPSAVARALEAYFAGRLDALADLPVATGGTPFQRRVWAALRTIPVGATASYRAIAAQIGHPAATRAVGAANGANPVAIIVPCHRVIAADGTLGGFGGGLDRKRWLLRHEGAAVRDAGSPQPAAGSRAPQRELGLDLP